MSKILILSDIHANLAALEAVLEQEGEWDEVIFLGDAVTYGPQPNEVVSRLREWKGTFLLGNHDRDMFKDYTGQDMSNPDLYWTYWTQQQLSPENLKFLASFQDTSVVERFGYRLRLYHGDILPVGKMLWPISEPAQFAALCEHYPEPYHLTGHVHVQYCKNVGDTLFLNPGGVGQQRLGHPLAFYALLTEEGFSLHSLPYDVERTCQAMNALPLPPDFIADWQQAYRTGFIPGRYASSRVDPLLAAGYR